MSYHKFDPKRGECVRCGVPVVRVLMGWEPRTCDKRSFLTAYGNLLVILSVACTVLFLYWR